MLNNMTISLDRNMDCGVSSQTGGSKCKYHKLNASSFAIARLIISACYQLVTGRDLMTGSFGDHRRRTIASPTFTRRSPENLQKIPSDTSRANSIIRSSHHITAAMLPSRGIVRSLPSGTFQRPIHGRSVRYMHKSDTPMVLYTDN